jgi:Spy/CpxP family protein refolding chaperone
MTMIQFRKQVLTSVAAVSLVAGSLAAYAGMPPDSGPTRGGPMSSEQRAQFDARMKERAAQRQAELHDALKLSPAQEAAWQAFSARMTSDQPPARPDRAEMEKLPAPERMERGLAMMQEHQKRMGERLAAVKEFYAVLTPEQQKVFDERFAQGRKHHRGS